MAVCVSFEGTKMIWYSKLSTRARTIYIQQSDSVWSASYVHDVFAQRVPLLPCWCPGSLRVRRLGALPPCKTHWRSVDHG